MILVLSQITLEQPAPHPETVVAAIASVALASPLARSSAKLARRVRNAARANAVRISVSSRRARIPVLLTTLTKIAVTITAVPQDSVCDFVENAVAVWADDWRHVPSRMALLGGHVRQTQAKWSIRSRATSYDKEQLG